MDEQSQIQQWATEYGIDGSQIIFDGYAALTRDILGTCSFAKDGQHIKVNKGLEGHDLYVRATLWHEFCHAWDYQESGTHGHGGGFWSKYMKKGWYVVIDFFAAIHLHTH